jgi:hypothetical protein
MAQSCFAMAAYSAGGFDRNRAPASDDVPSAKESKLGGKHRNLSPSRSAATTKNPSLSIGGANPLNVDFVNVKYDSVLAETAVANLPMVLLLRCANFAAVKHARQRRKDPQQTPYINHPLGKTPVNRDRIIRNFEC